MLPENQFQNQKLAPLKKKKTLRTVVLIAALFIVGAVVIYFLLNVKENGIAQKIEKTEQSDDPKRMITELERPTDTSSWKTYRNEEYGFEFKYPVEYNLTLTHTGDSQYTPILSFSIKDLESDLTAAVFIVELSSGRYCHLGLCKAEAKNVITVNKVEWDNLGKPLYNADFSSSYSFHYRTVYGNNRYYLLFSKEILGEEILSTVKFTDISGV
jgi:hypothetical protein